MNPPSGYSGHLPIIERVFASGVSPYLQPTGFDGYRFITGVIGRKESDIDPFWVPGNPARCSISDSPRIFTMDRRTDAIVEALGHTGNGCIPPGTFEIRFTISGVTLNHSKVADPEYRAQFFKDGEGKTEDHRFSQCVDYYLEQKGLVGSFDTHGWLTVAGQSHGLSGYVHGWKSDRKDTIQHVYTKEYTKA